jgi:hypothetical protein
MKVDVDDIICLDVGDRVPITTRPPGGRVTPPPPSPPAGE